MIWNIIINTCLIVSVCSLSYSIYVKINSNNMKRQWKNWLNNEKELKLFWTNAFDKEREESTKWKKIATDKQNEVNNLKQRINDTLTKTYFERKM